MKSKLAAVVAVAALLGSVGGAAAFPRVVTDLAAFRSGPGLTYLPILAIPPKTVIDVKGCSHGWCRADYAGGSGYIARSLLARPIAVAPVAVTPVVAVPVTQPLF